MNADHEAIRQVYLVRHGETGLNALGYIRGRANPPLDTAGMVEARALALALAPANPVKVVCSPLRRAVDTAGAIAAAVGLTPTMDPRFNDRDYGRWTGYFESKVVDEWGSLDRAPGIESRKSVLSRVRRALDEIGDSTPAGPVVIVTHDAVIRPLIMSIDPTRTMLLEPTGCWNHLERIDGTWIVMETDQKPQGESASSQKRR